MPMITIGKRTGISHGRIEPVLEHPDPKNLRYRLSLIERYKSKPETQWIINETPQLWVLNRICELAPTCLSPEIHEILEREAEAKNSNKKVFHKEGSRKRIQTRQSRFRAPSQHRISKIISALTLRERSTTVQLVSAKRRSRKGQRQPNSLSFAQRNALLEIAQQMVSARSFRPVNGIEPDDLRSEIMRLIEREAIFFKPWPFKTSEELAAQWERYLRARINYSFFPDSLRNIGPVTMQGVVRRPRQFSALELKEGELPATKFPSGVPQRIPLPTRQISFPRGHFNGLTRIEREVLDLLILGLSMKKISRQRGTTPSAVSQIIKTIRQKWVPAKEPR